MRITAFSISLFLLFLSACQSDSNPPQNKIISPPRLVFETVMDSMEMPRSSIFLSFDESKIKIDQIYACFKIIKEEYEKHDVPNNAIDACGGWWAGAGDYFYLLEEDDSYSVYKGSIDEMQEELDYGYEKLGVLSKNGNFSQQ